MRREKEINRLSVCRVVGIANGRGGGESGRMHDDWGRSWDAMRCVRGRGASLGVCEEPRGGGWWAAGVGAARCWFLRATL